MSQPGLRAPLTVLALGLLLVALALVHPIGGGPAFSQSYAVSTNTPTSYLPPGTAQPTAKPATAVSTAAPTTPTVTTSPQATSVAQPTPSPTPVVRQPAQAPTTRPTVTPIIPTATPPAATELVCVPGTVVSLRGQAPAYAALLIFFDTRVVGGGSAEANGAYALALKIGNERPGSYVVVVRVRGTWEEVARTSCTVPIVTPTPRPTQAFPV